MKKTKLETIKVINRELINDLRESRGEVRFLETRIETLNTTADNQEARINELQNEVDRATEKHGDQVLEARNALTSMMSIMTAHRPTLPYENTHYNRCFDEEVPF